MNISDFPPVMTVQQAADILSVSPSQVYVYIRRDGLPVVRLGRKFRIMGTDLLRWLEGQRVESGLTWVVPQTNGRR